VLTHIVKLVHLSANMQVKSAISGNASDSATSGDEVESGWAALASRAVRVTLARRDMSYAALAAALAEIGVPETFRAVEAKAQRGTFKFAFFLQLLVAVKADYPARWEQPLAADQTWEQRATAVLQTELSLLPWLTWAGLSARLSEIGVAVSAEELEIQAEIGTFPAVLFLQCAAVCRFESIVRFVDVSSLNDAALNGHRRAEARSSTSNLQNSPQHL
jgi:hypothetical protein